jgi:hypothetical protein
MEDLPKYLEVDFGFDILFLVSMAALDWTRKTNNSNTDFEFYAGDRFRISTGT